MSVALISILSFVVLLGVLVFVHELGHFLMAKRAGIRVEKFSLGFPPTIISREWRGTEYSIGLIPLGGFVKMAGESPDESPSGREDEFASKTIPQRMGVIMAGPIMNYLLAIALFAGLAFFIGTPLPDDNAPIVGMAVPDRPAEKAGLTAGDIILSINGEKVETFDSLASRIGKRRDQPVEIVWLRGADTLRATVRPEPQPVKRSDGTVDTVGQIGVRRQLIYDTTYSAWQAFAVGFTETNMMVWRIFDFLGKYVSRQVPANTVGGPLYIAQQSAEAAEQGAGPFFFLMALLSVNLAVLNVLPIPVLDGGHMVFLMVEAIKGSPISAKARMYAQQAGMVFLLAFVLYVSWNDLMRWLD